MRRPGRPRLALALGLALLLAAAAAGCVGADPDPGLDLALRIPGAQLVRAPFPGADLGPAITFLDVHAPSVLAGQAGKLVEGRAGPGTFAVAIGLEGDAGYWLVPIGLEDPAVPGDHVFAARADFARDLQSGEVTLLFQAIDRIERGGVPRSASLGVRSPVPEGELVVALEWDRDADVDLYVTMPDGVTVGPKNINSYEPPAPGQPPDPPDAWEEGCVLDVDSNANCASDGRRRENLVCARAPPPGRYRVAVDLAATCGQARTSFQVIVFLRGERLAAAAGALYEIDARESASGGAPPLLVTEFEVP